MPDLIIKSWFGLISRNCQTIIYEPEWVHDFIMLALWTDERMKKTEWTASIWQATHTANYYKSNRQHLSIMGWNVSDWNFSWATRELFICECMMSGGGGGTRVSFQISWSVNQQDFFFQHDNKSLLLLHFWLLMLCDLLISTVRNILDWVLESLLFCQHFCILNFVISQTHSLDYELTFDLNLPDTYGWWSTLQKGQSESAKMCQSDSEQWTFPLDISTIYINLTSDFHEKTIFLWSFRSQNIYMSL